MSHQNDTQIAHDEGHRAPQHRDDTGSSPSFGLRAAILAGLVAAAAGGAAAGGAVAAQGFTADPVQTVASTHSTCCPPKLNH